MSQVIAYQVYDRTCQAVIATYPCDPADEASVTKARRQAYRKAHRRDAEYGAVCCSVQHKRGV